MFNAIDYRIRVCNYIAPAHGDEYVTVPYEIADNSGHVKLRGAFEIYHDTYPSYDSSNPFTSEWIWIINYG